LRAEAKNAETYKNAAICRALLKLRIAAKRENRGKIAARKIAIFCKD